MIYDIEINSAAHYPAAGVIDLVELAEKVGFGAFWKGESNSTDPLVLISAAASRTKTIKLGTAIYHIYGRSPVTLGIQSATLQDLSGSLSNSVVRTAPSGKALHFDRLSAVSKVEPSAAADEPVL